MHTAITVLHVLLCLFLIIVILLQTGKGGDMGAAFGGGGGGGSTFGGRGAGSFLSKTTAVVATLFMVTSLSLAILSSRIDEESVIGDDTVPLESTVPEIPAPKPGVKVGDETPLTKPRMEIETKPIAATRMETETKPITSTPVLPVALEKPITIPKAVKSSDAPSSTTSSIPTVGEKEVTPVTTKKPTPSKAPQDNEKATPAPAATAH